MNDRDSDVDVVQENGVEVVICVVEVIVGDMGKVSCVLSGSRWRSGVVEVVSEVDEDGVVHGECRRGSSRDGRWDRERLGLELGRRRGDADGMRTGVLGGIGPVGSGAKVSRALVFGVDCGGSGGAFVVVGGAGDVVGGGALRVSSCCS